jgi:hypothetical protein
MKPNGMTPSSSAPAHTGVCSQLSDASVRSTAVVTTTAAEPLAKSSADAICAAKRGHAVVGRVRRKRSQSLSRAAAEPTPNWKNITPMMAKTTYAVIAPLARPGSFPSDPAKSAKNMAGRTIVGSTYAGVRSSSSIRVRK